MAASVIHSQVITASGTNIWNSVIYERSVQDGAAAAAAGKLKIQELCMHYGFMEEF